MAFRNVIRFVRGRLMLLGLNLLFVYAAQPATPTAESIAGWNDHVRDAKRQLEYEEANPDRFLPTRGESVVLEKVRAGKVVAAHAAHGAITPVPSGLVHHWTGEIFIRGASLPDTLRIMQDYDAYAEIYQPSLIDSKLVEHIGDQYKYRLKFQQKGFGVKIGLAGNFTSSFRQLTPATGYSITEASDLVELDNPGTSTEHELRGEEAHGYVQRTFTIARYRANDGGVYLEVETVTLSRDIPAAVRWLVTPLVQRFSKQVMTTTLEKFRDRVESERRVEMAGSGGGMSPAGRASRLAFAAAAK
jgi:hypothetical protein